VADIFTPVFFLSIGAKFDVSLLNPMKSDHEDRHRSNREGGRRLGSAVDQVQSAWRGDRDDPAG
jgi:hypothetical protein